MSDIEKVVQAVEDINTGFEEYKKANDANLGARDVVLEEKLERIEADLTRAQEIADEAVLAAKRSQRNAVDEAGNEIDMDKKAADWAQSMAVRSGRRVDDFGADELREYGKTFDKYMRRGKEELTDLERKSLSVGSDPDGGYTVHPDLGGRITSRVFETSAVRAYANVQVISTDALEGMFDNNEASSGWVSETGARSTTNTPELGAWRIPTHELYAAPLATQKLLDDSAINIEQWLSGKVTAKFARDEASAVVSGNGVGKPRGFLTYDDYAVAGTFENGKIEQFDSGANGAFVAAPNGGDVLISALYGLKSAYMQNATWFSSRGTLAALRKIKDSNGAYIWVPGGQAGEPSMIFGRPHASFEDMPVLATGSLSIAVGDMREAYQIVDRMGVRVIRDVYSTKPYVEFYTTKRVGGDVVNFEALKLINFKA